MINIDWRDQLVRLDEKFTDELIPLKEAVAFLGINIVSAQNDKDFPMTRIGGRYYVPKMRLAKYLSK